MGTKRKKRKEFPENSPFGAPFFFSILLVLKVLKILKILKVLSGPKKAQSFAHWKFYSTDWSCQLWPAPSLKIHQNIAKSTGMT